MRWVKRLAKRFIFLVISAFYKIAPGYVSEVVDAKVQRMNSQRPARFMSAAPVKNPEISVGSVMTDSIEVPPENEEAIIKRLIASYTAATDRQAFAATPYLPGAAWKKVLDPGWQDYRQAISQNDEMLLAKMLRNCFRNEALSGFWGGMKMFQTFCELNEYERDRRIDLFKMQYEAWRRHFPHTPMEELAAPRIGNPWGYVVGGELLYEPVFEYHYHAHYFQTLLAPLEAPLVLEIGGGFGGLAYHILKCAPSTKYIGLDLPENILLQAYYLSSAFPKARILTFSKEIEMVNRETIDAYDIILMPNFMTPQIASSTADLIVNVRSLSEMPSESIAEYIRQIDRIGRLWFFHENIFKARLDGLFGIPSSEFPKPFDHILVAASESRWPRYDRNSAYPCQENLYLKRNVIQRPTS